MSGKHHADEPWQEAGRAAPEQRKAGGWENPTRNDDEEAADLRQPFDPKLAQHHREVNARNRRGEGPWKR